MRVLWDKFLMVNLLFLGLCFLWFTVLVVALYLFRADLGWGFFRQAWTLVINPSLGIFFLGVMISFFQSKWRQRKDSAVP
ncbi:hypothetical protein [Anthocerotibacter panamensis]|uniref:hypothetical protein n=1 Tax=Anthocerotibacter panamensis TaxID=2857077 RepID=UPI001C4062E2|nr:hypothetical protein [Anthocerotibacter panamensis]